MINVIFEVEKFINVDPQESCGAYPYDLLIVNIDMYQFSIDFLSV